MMTRSFLCFALSLIASTALADSWAPISVVNAPTARGAHSAVFTRIDVTDQMIVWGDSGECCSNWFNDGFAYRP